MALGLRKKRVEGEIDVELEGTVDRDASAMLRVSLIKATVIVTTGEENWKKVRDAFGIFKKYCIVSESIERGISIEDLLEIRKPQ